MKRLLGILAAGSIALNVALLANTRFGDFLQATVTSSSSYPFLSQRIFVQHANDVIINFTALRSELRSFVGQPREFRTGVYFEYLPSGVSIGVNEKDEFVSASLLKVPFIMGVFKRIEEGAIGQSDTLTLSEYDLDPRFGTLWKRGAGAELPVAEAIHLGLTQSDNTAINVLDHYMSQDVSLEVHNALDIPINIAGDLPVVSPKNYASIFRCLYLSCFLTYESSQKILEILTQTIFKNGIEAGVPAEIPVAHKVGLYDHPNHDGGVRSDCGIVYVPKRPYILCVIVEGNAKQEEAMVEFMHEVSARVYRFVRNM